MKIGKRLISCLLAICLIFSLCVMPVSAEDDVFTYPEYGTKAYGRMEFMKALGFFDESRSAELGNGVTRAEFANWLCIISNRNDVAIPETATFKDVNEDTLYAKEIYMAAAAGYMSGNDEGKFAPAALITRQDAAAALVRLTGREAFAQAKGGYPAGYNSVASSLDIFKSAGAGESAYELLTMCYNTLNATMLIFSGANHNVSTYTTTETVMGYFHDIYEVEGVVTANGYTKLYSENVIASPTAVEIDSIVYETVSDYNDLLGYTVNGFYRYDKLSDERTIVSIYADNDDNKTVEFEKDELIPTDLSSNYILKYHDENSRVKQIKLVRGFDYIYNNRADTDRGANDLFTADRIRLIDRNTDGSYDTVIAEKCETMLLSAVDMYKEEVYTNVAVLKKAETYGAYMSFELYDSEEDTMTEVFPEQLEEGMVLSVYRSLDGMYIKAYASSDTVTGAVEGYDNEEVKIMLSGIWYDLADSVTVAEFELGTDTDVLLDVYGRVAYIDGVGGKYDFKYAWLFSVREDVDAEAVVAKLVTKSGQIKLNLDKNVIIDGIKASDTAALVLGKQVVRYKINKAGNIRVIDTTATGSGSPSNDTLTEDVPAQSLKYYSLPGILAGSYKITGSTFTLVVPGIVSERNYIDLYDTKFDLSTEPQNYQFACYDIDAEDASIGVCIYYPQESLMGQVTTDGGAAIGVIQKLQRDVWIDGEVEDLVTIYTSEGEKTYVAADSLTDDDLDDFDFGDVVRYVINSNGQVSTIFMECDVTGTSGATHPSSRVTLTENANGYYNYNFGRVLKKEKDYFIMLANENNQGFANDGLSYRRIIYTAKMNYCWMVDMSENKITDCDMSNVTEYIAGAESPSYVYARTYKYYNLNHLVVYKY